MNSGEKLVWKFQLFKNRKIVSERRSRTHSGLRYFGRLLSKSLGLKNCFQLLKELLSSLIAVACLLAAAVAAASVTGSGKRDREEQNALTSFGSVEERLPSRLRKSTRAQSHSVIAVCKPRRPGCGSAVGNVLRGQESSPLC